MGNGIGSAAGRVAAAVATATLAAGAHAQQFTHSGKECRVKTELKKKVAKPVTERIDRYCAHFEEFYDALGLRAKASNKVVVRLFATYDDYEEFYQRSNPGESPPGAYFSRSLNGVVAYHDEADVHLRQVLFHETSHQYLNRYTTAAPKWANEGLAEYFEGWQLAPDGALVKKRPSLYDLTVLQAALRSDEALAPKTLVEMEPKTFMDFRDEFPELRGYLHYATSWGLVYYFLEGPDEADRERFLSYLRALNEDGERAAPLAIDDWAAFEERWRAYVLSLEPTPETADDWMLLASNQRQERAYEDAIASYEKALALDPALPGARYWLGYCCKREGDYDAARPHLERAMEEDPSDPRPPYMLARIVAGVDRESAPKDPAAALALAEEASRRADDESAVYLAFVARCQHLSGDARAAARTMRKVLKLVKDEDDDVRAYYEQLAEEYGR